jgi:putative glutamine amidotransferase
VPSPEGRTRRPGSKATVAAYAAELDALVLMGGSDVCPESYGETALRPEWNGDRIRDDYEIALLNAFMDEHKPVLGVCRGAQVINVAMGGTLWQDLGAQRPDGIKHDYFPTFGFDRDHLAHEVTLTSGSRLRQLMELDRIPVNSMHHQGIRTLAPTLVAAAVAPDGLIEAAEGPDREHFLMGVQWHPEVFEITDPHTRHVFHEFVREAGARRGART